MVVLAKSTADKVVVYNLLHRCLIKTGKVSFENFFMILHDNRTRTMKFNVVGSLFFILYISIIKAEVNVKRCEKPWTSKIRQP